MVPAHTYTACGVSLPAQPPPPLHADPLYACSSGVLAPAAQLPKQQAPAGAGTSAAGPAGGGDASADDELGSGAALLAPHAVHNPLFQQQHQQPLQPLQPQQQQPEDDDEEVEMAAGHNPLFQLQPQPKPAAAAGLGEIEPADDDI